MDPNAALASLRDALTTAREAADGDSNDAEIEAWQEVGDYIESLDEWLSKGGFKPEDWEGDDLRLSFSPRAIREHFGDDEDPRREQVEALTDEQLRVVGETALGDDGLYRAFHDSLDWALDETEES